MFSRSRRSSGHQLGSRNDSRHARFGRGFPLRSPRAAGAPTANAWRPGRGGPGPVAATADRIDQFAARVTLDRQRLPRQTKRIVHAPASVLAARQHAVGVSSHGELAGNESGAASLWHIITCFKSRQSKQFQLLLDCLTVLLLEPGQPLTNAKPPKGILKLVQIATM